MYTEYLKQLTSLMFKCKIYQGHQLVEDWEKGFHELVSCFLETKKTDRHLMFIGNGGSASIASHMTADFLKNGGIRTIGLFDCSLMTCMGNDYSYEYIFSKPLELLAHEGDLLIAISSSGNSMNIVNAINMAQSKGLKVLTFSGFREDNAINRMGDYNLYVPVEDYGLVESIHNLFLQQIVDTIKKET